MKLRFLAIPIFMIGLVACATTAKYEAVLNTWVGAEETNLVRKWGPPQQVYETGDVKFLTYTSSRKIYVPGSAPSYNTTVSGNTAYTTPIGGSPAYNINKRCVTTFEISEGRIVRWRWEGNDCRAK